MKKFYSLLIFMSLTVTAWSQTRTWNGGSGAWNDGTNWSPAGVPAPSDVLEFNGISGTISNVPTLAFRGINVIGSTIILNGSGSDAKTLTIGNSNADTAIIINAGASLTIGNSLNIALANNSRAAIDGTLIVSTNRGYYTNTGETTKTIVNGTLQNNGGNIMSAASMLEFRSGALYKHMRDKGTIPAAAWDKNSTCSIEGVITNAPGGINQVFGNYKWDCPHQTTGGDFLGNTIPSEIKGDLVINKMGTAIASGILQIPGTVKIGGAFILNEGICITMGVNTTIDLAGDLILKGGSLKANPALKNAVINFNFNGTAKQLLLKTGGTFRNTKFTVVNNAIVDLGEFVVDGDADFIVAPGGKLITAHPSGIALTGAIGAIQVSGARIFSANADYAFTGSVPQATGAGLPATVRRLYIDNHAGLQAGSGVSLSKATMISTELVLINGFLKTTQDDILTIADGGEVTAGNNSFVAGPVRKKGNSSFIFPTGWEGTGGGRVPIGISSMKTIATIQAEYKRAPATNKGSTINAPLHHISYCEYWELFPIAGSADPTAIVTMYRNAYSTCNPVSNINDFSSVRVARSNGIEWRQVGNSYDSLDAGNGYVVSDSTGLTVNTREKYFTLGNIATAKDPLPVMFDNVSAYKKNDGVNIEWSNLTERDIAIYYVERSINGKDYKVIGQYLPKSNRDDKVSYIYFDDSPSPGINFYRIKVIEKNTKIIFSKILRIEIDKPKAGFSLYPNPAINSQFIISFTGIKEGRYMLRMFNTMGQEVYQDIVINRGSPSTQILRLPSSVRQGIYNVIITGNDYREKKALIVQ
ncbi:MAG TPA: T9SS type A sorting domain-containing protein [Chitinophagaceae bacterium]|nr:T9SS type A sorting domain-containing protein [Chitinophagaceae bacterium]